MFPKPSGIRGILLLALFLCVLLTGCSGSLPMRILGKESVAVMPLIKGRNERNPLYTLACPYDQFCFDKEQMKPDADETITGLLQEKLMARLEDRVTSLKNVRRSHARILSENRDATARELAEKLGNELGVDYVVVGNVWRYREREGSAYSVSEPASVAFAVYLLKVKNGRTVWSSQFNETQQSLSENLLKAPEFFQRGAKWLKVRELARYGVEDVVSRFPLE